MFCLKSSQQNSFSKEPGFKILQIKKSSEQISFEFYQLSFEWWMLWLVCQDFMNQFSAAQAAILEASAAAAEAAKANVHQAYKEAFRIRLNIQLKVSWATASFVYWSVKVKKSGTFVWLNFSRKYYWSPYHQLLPIYPHYCWESRNYHWVHS